MTTYLIGVSVAIGLVLMIYGCLKAASIYDEREDHIYRDKKEGDDHDERATG